VGFRYFVVDRARRLRLSGWVANLPDGSVRCVAEGDEGSLQELLGALWNGPAAARVDAVSVAWSDGTAEFAGFGTRSGGHPGD
jgi:acylphosphatase